MSFTDEGIEDLKKFGFNVYQAKVYTALVGLGVATASEISQASEVPPNKVYSVLDSLKKKGYVLAQESDTTTNRYRPRSPDTVIKNLRDEYEKSFKKTEERLFALYERSKKAYIPEMWILRGSQAVFSKIKEMIISAKEEIHIGIDTPFDLHLHGIDEELRQKSKDVNKIKILTGSEGIDNPGEMKVLKSLNDHTEIHITKNFHAIWVIIDNEEILQGAYAQLEGGIELGIMATWSDNKSFAELWQHFSTTLWEKGEKLSKIIEQEEKGKNN
jgi:sugar-specific transcriptional regulator TrmB